MEQHNSIKAITQNLVIHPVLNPVRTCDKYSDYNTNTGMLHIAQTIQDLSDDTQQNNLHSLQENTSFIADDTTTSCDFNVIDQHSVTENANDTNTPCVPKPSGIHSQQKHTYRNTFGKSNIQYHDFDNQDSLTFTDKINSIVTTKISKSILEFS